MKTWDDLDWGQKVKVLMKERDLHKAVIYSTELVEHRTPDGSRYTEKWYRFCEAQDLLHNYSIGYKPYTYKWRGSHRWNLIQELRKSLVTA